jgi:hypothetical protein
MHTGHHQRLFCSQRREQAGQPLGHHGLSGARWTHHQQVVAARGGYLERMAAESLTPDIGQVGQVGRWWGGHRRRDYRPCRAGSQYPDQVSQR